MDSWAEVLWDDRKCSRDAGGNKLRTYYTGVLRGTLGTSHAYLDVVRVQPHQRTLSRFRVSTHSLHVLRQGGTTTPG